MCCSNGTAPAAGIDLEPDGVYYDLENITIRDCFAVNNTGHGLQSYLVSGEAHAVSILVERYHVIGAGATTPGRMPCWGAPSRCASDTYGGGFFFGRLHPPGGSIVIRDSTVMNTPSNVK